MIWNIERPVNDVNTIRSYAPNSLDRKRLVDELAAMRKTTVDIPLIIDGKEVTTGSAVDVRSPDDHSVLLARAQMAGPAELKRAVDSALAAHDRWAKMDWYHRVAVFQKAAALLSGPRRTRNIAAIMLNHSKNPYEAEIDLAELVDFWSFNAYFTRQIYEMQPNQYPGRRTGSTGGLSRDSSSRSRRSTSTPSPGTSRRRPRWSAMSRCGSRPVR